MIRAGLLWLSEQSRIFGFIRGNGLARRLAARFVAGGTVEAAVAALQGLNASGMAASLDLLGESVTSLSEARAARDTYLETLDRIRTVGADANVSVKLTQMGLEVDERVCVENLRAIMARARSYGTFVRIDMEQWPIPRTRCSCSSGRSIPSSGTSSASCSSRICDAPSATWRR